MYADVIVIVDGAVEDEECFRDYLVMAEFVQTIADEAASHGYPTEIYVVHHEHDDLGPDEECACVQHLSDHRPKYAYNEQG